SEVRFHISDEGWNQVAFEEATLTAWSLSERAFLAAMPQRIIEGHHLDDALETIGSLDRRIAEESVRLREAARERKVALRSALFANAYVGQSIAAPGITRICAGLHGGLFRTTSDVVTSTIERRLAEGTVSPRQLYLLLMLSRG